ncbi:hypothetical protein HPP92_022705 [Vanilla planifolia]|uniref:Uncharacterized protein n=1 Tax=Vanilla planifolia TaxID=51239 RepID=A0A835PUF6_VANPL|nr:hypothetical protein HPP92_023001 [Vanilla planifolia]KAG0459577.1 hypothetical protein HPP92_022705 [Vanilla planifolia]
MANTQSILCSGGRRPTTSFFTVDLVTIENPPVLLWKTLTAPSRQVVDLVDAETVSACLNGVWTARFSRSMK